MGNEVTDKAIHALKDKKIDFESSQLALDHSEENKDYLNLAYVAQLQLQTLNILPENIIQTKVDTYSDENWHSHRREAGNAGRNIHLVLKY